MSASILLVPCEVGKTDWIWLVSLYHVSYFPFSQHVDTFLEIKIWWTFTSIDYFSCINCTIKNIYVIFLLHFTSYCDDSWKCSYLLRYIFLYSYLICYWWVSVALYLLQIKLCVYTVFSCNHFVSWCSTVLPMKRFWYLEEVTLTGDPVASSMWMQGPISKEKHLKSKQTNTYKRG